ncbi:hypothetical protein DICPUDRAFT_152296 [Dictyostelium purpureum]|uniref:Acyl-coenzyme A oxidase n=1 Tax=Dictyostelium purpureum TaxID=5786 RepID=F0ZKZ7_DICPU|nr:uncharacterized protein DICPUDRAFT_152296 [Dictyostelium purpureum]EGC35351.1 hypothetical protein DICPUDRAFT_152296 [Dictyostelium purpureum]|eukprot:XP_003288089.1 hypothetical protein DICPUDRAFT_152296 [Dictyostelium purpureum]
MKEIKNHLEVNNNEKSNSLESELFRPIQENINIQDFKVLVDSVEAHKYKDAARAFIRTNPKFKENFIGLDMSSYRQLVLEQCEEFAKSGLVHFTDIKQNIFRYAGIVEMLALFNNNICTKLGVHFTLFGGTIMFLGTERHQKYIEDANTLKTVGCFSMTEIGHGSNVRGIETTAHYDPSTKEFIINSPTPTSQKFWIGGSYLHATYTTVFANLIIKGVNHGVHAFVVTLRDKNGNVLPKITIKDCGHKLGLNGIDNGQLKFDHVRIPRENLLNKYSDVTEDGTYKSQFSSPIKNFAATMAPFIAGRMAITKGCSGALKTSLAIAIDFSYVRKQFGPTLENEQPLITLSSQQRRLMAPLARTILFDLYVQRLTRELAQPKQPISIHAHCSGIKAIYSWHCVQNLQVCREACGGQGYRSANRIAEFKNDCDIICTYEGDNTVLMQQLAKYLLALPESKVQQPTIYLDGDDAKSLLFNFENIKRLFDQREQMRLKELKQIISNSKESSYNAFNNAIPWSVKLGYAHMNKIVFDHAITTLKENNVKPLAHLIMLDSLVTIEEDLGWFVTNHLISSNVAKAIPFLIQDLCSEVTKVSRQILESFDIPENCKAPSKDLISDLF